MVSVSYTIKREVDVYVAIGRGRELATTLGFNEIDRTRIEIVILELTRNLLMHAGGGQITIDEVDEHGRRGMLITTSDTGPGIADVDLALRDGYSTTKTLGAGLPGVKRLMDTLLIESVVGEGTRVQAIKWLPTRPSPTSHSLKGQRRW